MAKEPSLAPILPNGNHKESIKTLRKRPITLQPEPAQEQQGEQILESCEDDVPETTTFKPKMARLQPDRYWITNGSPTKSILCHLFSAMPSPPPSPFYFCHISDTPLFVPVPFVSVKN